MWNVLKQQRYVCIVFFCLLFSYQLVIGQNTQVTDKGHVAPELLVSKTPGNVNTQLSFSNDGKYIITSGGGTINVWDFRTGLLVNSYEEVNSDDNFMLASPTQNLIVSTYWGSVKFIDVENDSVVGFKDLPDGSLRTKFSPDGSYLLTKSHNYEFNKPDEYLLWDTKTKKREKLPSVEGEYFTFSKDGKYLVSNSNFFYYKTAIDGFAKTIIPLVRDSLRKYIPDRLLGIIPTKNLYGFSSRAISDSLYNKIVSPNRKFFMTRKPGHSWSLYDAASGEIVHRIVSKNNVELLDFDFSPDSKYYAVCDRGKTITIWETKSHRKVQTIKGHTEEITKVAPIQQTSKLVAGNREGSMIWDLASFQNHAFFKCFADNVSCISYSKDGSTLLAGKYAGFYQDQNTVFSWDLEKKEKSGLIQFWRLQPVYDVGFYNDDSQVLAGLGYKSKLFDLEGKELAEFGNANQVEELSGGIVGAAIGGEVWIDDKTATKTILKLKPPLTAMGVGKDLGLVAAASLEKEFKVYDNNFGQIVADTVLEQVVTAISFLPNRKSCLLGCADNNIYICDVKGARLKKRFEGHQSIPTIIQPINDSIVLSATFDGELILWDFFTGAPISMLGINNAIRDIKLHPQKGVIAIATNKNIELRAIADLKLLEELPASLTACVDVTISDTDILAAFNGNILQKVDLNGDELSLPCSIFPNTYNKIPFGVETNIKMVKYSPDKRFVVAVVRMLSRDRFFVIDSGLKNKPKIFDNIHRNSITDFLFLNDGNTVVSVDNGNDMRVWDYLTGITVDTLEVNGGASAIVYSQKENKLILGLVNKGVTQLDLGSGMLETIYEDSAFYKKMVLSDDEKFFATFRSGWGNVEIWNYTEKKRIGEIVTNSYKVKKIGFYKKSKFLYTVDDNCIKLWDVATQKEVASLVVLEGENWLISCPDGYFTCSKGALGKIGFKVGKDVFQFDQFDLKFNRPDIVLARLSMAESELIEIYHKAYLKRLKRVNFTEDMLSDDWHIPDLEIIDKESIKYEADKPEIEIKIHASDPRQKLDRINAWVNNVPVYGSEGINLRGEQVSDIAKTLKIKLGQGENKIEVSVMNQNGAESYKQNIYVQYLPQKVRKPDLYVVSIGVSKYKDKKNNLKYATKDGRDIIDFFKSNKSNIWENIYVDSLFDNNVNVDGIKGLKDRLLKSKVDDQVVLFISGHGLLDDNLDFYFASHNMNFNDPARHGIAYSTLEGLLDGIPARKKLMLIDACHSGETDKSDFVENENKEISLPDGSKGRVTLASKGGKNNVSKKRRKTGLQNSFELMQQLFADLSRSSGAVVLSAAAGQGYALESAEWNNGAFTYSLLSGLKSMKADTDGDGRITVSELKGYVIDKVVEITNGRQKPTVRNDNLEFDFRVW